MVSLILLRMVQSPCDGHCCAANWRASASRWKSSRSARGLPTGRGRRGFAIQGLYLRREVRSGFQSNKVGGMVVARSDRLQRGYRERAQDRDMGPYPNAKLADIPLGVFESEFEMG